MTIHKEGRTLLVVLLVALIVINGLVRYYAPQQTFVQYLVLGVSIVFYLLILQFFRHPFRKINIQPNQVIAPADGKIVVIEDVEEPEYFQGKRKQISIFMSPVNVHVNRSPIEGFVKYFKYHPGKYLVAWHPKASTENERTTMVVEHPQHGPVLVRQIAGALAKRIKWYVREGQTLSQGGEYGFIKFGSRVDVYLPTDVEVKVQLNQVSKGGITVLAEFNTKK
ncbi:MAG: phosphatidylserine decarboxylase family protein [Cytophagaceae bacterium]|jgi:phosphatidylserine decarboxylase|nr:phosphatidylserine decarboxylase family protein [Cytophagaceae bacterium]